MFGPILHGSYGKEEKDYEACDALRTLLEAEAIKHCGDEEFLGRIDTELQKQLAAMQRVDSLIAGLRSGWDDDEDMYQSSPRGSTRADSRTVDDFLARINQSRRSEHKKNLTPLRG